MEIVKIVFDFRPVRHFETHSVKEFDHTLQGQGYRMQAAAFQSASGQGNVEGFGGKSGLQLGFVEGIAFGIKSRLKPVFAFIDMRTYGFALFRRHLPQSFQKSGQLAGFAKITGFDLF